MQLAVGGPKFQIFNSKRITRTLQKPYDPFETLFSYIHTSDKHHKVDKITKKKWLLCKIALSALRSSQNEPLEGQNLIFSTQTSPQTRPIHSTTCLKHFSQTTILLKSTGKSRKSEKRFFFCSKTALSALQSIQNEPLERQNLKSSSQKASNTPSNHSYNTFETLFSYIHTSGKHRKVDKITKKRVFCAKLHQVLCGAVKTRRWRAKT